MSNWSDIAPPRSGSLKDGDFTLVEHPEPGNRGLAVRPVTPEEKKMVWRWGGFLFATVADAEEFAEGGMQLREPAVDARAAEMRLAVRD